MKHKLALETTVEDSAGNEFEVTVKVDAETYFDREEGGTFIDEVNLSEVELKGKFATIKLQYVEDMPDIFNQDQLRKIYNDAEERVLSDRSETIEHYKSMRYEFN